MTDFSAFRDKRHKYYLVDEYWRMWRGGLIFKRFSPLAKLYNNAIVRFREGGILDVIREKYVADPTKDQGNQERDRVVLTISHFEGPFSLILVMFAIDIFAFFVEMFTFKFQNWMADDRLPI